MPMCALLSLRHVRSALHCWALLLLVVVAPPVSGAQSYAEEDRSWNIAPPPGYRAKDYHAPTPDSIPGATVVHTAALQAMLAGEKRPFLVDVLSGPAHPTLPGALWLHNGGLGDFDADEEKRFVQVLGRLSGHDKGREIVFFCSGARCWLSYNAALRAVRGGYGNVYWYRGGIDAWRAADLPTRTSDNFQW
jgi:PQQ-dependent catabolism-associated CXXCW motif protein